MGFWSGVKKFFSNFFSNAPSTLDKVNQIITVVAPLSQTIVMLTAGTDAAAQAVTIAGEVENDLTKISDLIRKIQAGTAPVGTADQIKAILKGISDNLNTLLVAGHIKNPDTLAKVTAIVNTIIAELNAIVSLIPQQAQQ